MVRCQTMTCNKLESRHTHDTYFFPATCVICLTHSTTHSSLFLPFLSSSCLAGFSHPTTHTPFTLSHLTLVSYTLSFCLSHSHHTILSSLPPSFSSFMVLTPHLTLLSLFLTPSSCLTSLSPYISFFPSSFLPVPYTPPHTLPSLMM